jgi:hypothetical protein
MFDVCRRLVITFAMTTTARGVSAVIGLAAIMIAWKLLGMDEVVQVFKKKQLKEKYDYIIGMAINMCNL